MENLLSSLKKIEIDQRPITISLPDYKPLPYRKKDVSGRRFTKKEAMKNIAESRLMCFFDNTSYLPYLEEKFSMSIDIDRFDDPYITEEEKSVENSCWSDFSRFNNYEDPTPPVINSEQLLYIWKRSIDNWFERALNFYLKKYKIVNRTRLCFFIANISHESGGGRYFEEIASGAAYEGRKDLGNIHEGDGVRFKGGGLMQTTGRYNYTQLSKAMNDPEILQGYKYVANRFPILSAFAFWQQYDINNYIDRGASFKQVVKKVNGGYNGLSHRKKYLKRCYEVL